MKLLRLIFSLIFFLHISSCSENEEVIPYTYVNIRLPLTRYTDLNAYGNHVEIQEGYSGIIVYRLNSNEFFAYDRTCTFEPFQKNAIKVSGQGEHIGRCPICKSEFILIDGSPSKGPARHMLKQYNTRFENNILYIYN